jgi:hypothetical protein
MSLNTRHPSDIISTAGLLTLLGGGFKLPSVVTANRPTVPGAIWYNSTTQKVEFTNDGSNYKAADGSTGIDFSADQHFAVGSLGTLSWNFAGDTDTGVYRPNANEMAVVTNGSVTATFKSTAIDFSKDVNLLDDVVISGPTLTLDTVDTTITNGTLLVDTVDINISGGTILIDGTTPTIDIEGATTTITDGSVVMAGNVSQTFGSTTSLVLNYTPTLAGQAVTKGYVDTVALSGVRPYLPVRVASTANLTLSGEQTIDGVSAVAGDRVLVKNQTTGSQNGVYVVAVGAWSRATDMDTSGEVVEGAYFFVQEGTTQESTAWVLITPGAYTLDTTTLTWVQFTSAGAFDGTGASTDKTGVQIYVRSTATSGQILRSTGTDGQEATWGALDLSNSNSLSNTLGISYLNINGGTATSTYNASSKIPIYEATATANRSISFADLATGLSTTSTFDNRFINTAGDTMTGALGLVVGTVGAPGLFFTGDTNTGLAQIDGADTLAIVAQGAIAASFTNPASAVNLLTITGAATGNIPSLAATGSDTNISLDLRSKGTGDINLKTNTSTIQAKIVHTASAVNYFQLTGSVASSPVLLAPVGSDANISVQVTSKGGGSLSFRTNAAAQEHLRIPHVGSAVNYWSLSGSVTGTDLPLAAAGTDTNINIYLSTKGTGSAVFATNSTVPQVKVVHTPSSVDFLTLTGGVGSGTLTIDGSTTNSGINILAKNSGTLVFGNGQQANIIQIGSNPTGVNSFLFTGAATANIPSFGVQGADTNIGLSIFSKGTGEILLRTNGSTSQMRIIHTASATDYVTATGGIGEAILSVAGNSTNVTARLRAKGNSNVILGNLLSDPFVVTGVASGINGVQVTGSATGVAPILAAFGTDTNIDLSISSKGTGIVTITGTQGIKIPEGTTGQRRVSPSRDLRFNTTIGGWEGYTGTLWRQLDKSYHPVINQSADYTIALDAQDSLIIGEPTVAHITYTLPDASDAGNGFTLLIKNNGNSSFNVNVATVGGNVIDGSSSFSVEDSYTLTLVSDGSTTWRICSYVTTAIISGNSININGLTAENSISAGNDYLVVYDASAGANRKTRVQDINSMVLLDRQTASASSALTFTGLTGYRDYVFRFENVVPSNAGASLYMRASKDNGSTFLTAGNPYNYAWHVFIHTASDGAQGSSAAAQVTVADTVSADSNYGVSGELVFNNPASTAPFKQGIFHMYYYSNGAVFAGFSGGFGVTTGDANPVDAVTFLFSAGTLASGTISVFGIR